jgi:ABC-type transport system involved in cytochrome c biogenesis permease subunit
MHSLALFLLQSPPDQEAIQKMVVAMMAIMPIFFLIGVAIVVIPTWFLCKKAGFTPWLSLICVIPFGVLILLYVLAFAEWPSQRPPIQANWANPPLPPQPPFPQG